VMGYQATNMKFGMMGWTKNSDVLAQTPFNPDTQPDFPTEGTVANTSEAQKEESAPEPVSSTAVPAQPEVANPLATAEPSAPQPAEQSNNMIWVYILGIIAVAGIGTYAGFARKTEKDAS